MKKSAGLAVLDNFSPRMQQERAAEVLLSRTSVREKLIENMMTEADRYGFDGINLDFESFEDGGGRPLH